MLPGLGRIKNPPPCDFYNYGYIYDKNDAMHHRLKQIPVLAAFLFLFTAPLAGQFYYGHQMDFGKNRVQYYDFFWSFYRFDKFDTYYNEYGREIAENTSRYAEKRIQELEDFFDYTLEKRLIFIVYNKLSDFRQSNAGLVQGDEEFNLGGVTRIIENKVFLFFEGDYKQLERQITGAITETIIQEMLYGGVLKNRITSNTQIHLPEWYVSGLVSYLANEWNPETENRIRDGFLSGRYEKLNSLEHEDADLAGHSFWKFISREYGKSVIPNIIYLTRINKNANKGFLFVTGKRIKELVKDWDAFYTDLYSNDGIWEVLPDGTPVLKKPKARRIINQVKISPDGNRIAYVSNELGQIKIWVYDEESGRQKKIFRKYPKLEQIIDDSYPILAWHPSGKLITYIMEEKGGLTLNYYLLETGKTETRNLLYFDKVLSFDYSDDGTMLVLSAVKEGMSDIYVHYVSSNTNEQITRDLADDLQPAFIDGSDGIIFTSNRVRDTLSLRGPLDEQTTDQYQLFIYDFKNRSEILTRLEGENFEEKYYPLESRKSEFLTIDNQTGILNRYLNRFDSVIAYIDTTVHYRYLANSQPLTNYSRNIEEHDFHPGDDQLAEVVFNDGKYQLYTKSLDRNPGLRMQDMPVTTQWVNYKKYLSREDSLEDLKQKIIGEHLRYMEELKKTQLAESPFNRQPVDINRYIFEQEKSYYYNRYIRNAPPGFRVDTSSFRLPKIRIYQTFFYNNYFANKIDYSFLAASYQSFTSSVPAFYNPGLNMLFKIGTHDLFEDYKITGGFRFAGNFDSNEYLISIENLKGKFDKQLIFHRQAYLNSAENGLIKTYTHELNYSMKYPFNQVLSLKGTLGLRNDDNVSLATDIRTLYQDDQTRLWSMLKMELTYDNTRYRGVNLMFGTRFKIFGEAYYQLNRARSDLFVLGADFRHYLQIHRDLIWANRFAASTSFGTNKLVYFLGGVDNWINLFPNRVQQFDQSIPVSPDQNYVFQALATNMRGFTQNIRNGNNFALINSEIRWPVFRYFANHPLGSNFLDSFQIIAFGDVGTAWTGKSPYSGDNAYDKEVIENGPITVVINTDREPIVAGFGAGLRTQLFGYFIRADYAWGIENYTLLKPILYLSFSMDF